MTAEFRRFLEKRHVRKELGITAQGKREVEVGTFLLGNNENIFTVDKVLSYF